MKYDNIFLYVPTKKPKEKNAAEKPKAWNWLRNLEKY